MAHRSGSVGRTMDSIDDILNASDSDEDNHVDTAGVDLELLLEDDDEDPVILTEQVSRSSHAFAPSVGTTYVNPTTEKSSRVQPKAATSNAFRETNVDLERLIAGDDDLSDPISPKLPAGLERAELTTIETGFNYRKTLAESSPSLKSFTLDQTITEVEKDDDSASGERGDLASLTLAEKREQRFLMAGIRDVISALQSKKRRDDGTGSNNVKCVEMDIISTQLRKNASFRSHGPGVATVLSIHAKFIAVGTSRGLVLLFDHEQEIRQVIGSAVGATARCTTGVSAVDISTSGLTLVCGYDTGEVALWDVTKGSLLKRVTDVHSYPICRMKMMLCVGDGYAGPGAGAGIASASDVFVVSVDVRGCVHRIKISKMLWTSYISEAECLLDGTAGAVTDMDMLSPFRPPTGSELVLWNSQVGLGAGNQFIALNSLTRTLLVQIHPSIKIRFRWSAPPGSHDPVSGGVLPEIMASLSWSWVNSADCVFAPWIPATGVSESASTGTGIEATKPVAYAPPPAVSSHYPVLARSWGSTVQLLVVYPTIQAGKEEGYQCSLLAEKSFPGSKFVGVKWLAQGTSMAIMTFTEVFIVRRNLEIVEVCPMLPALCSSLRTMFDSRMSLDQALRAVTWVFSEKLYFLSPEALYIFHVQSWKEVVDQLIIAGNWLDALSAALDNFRKEANNTTNVDRTLINKYIKKYVDLAVSQSSAGGLAAGKNGTVGGQQRNHFHLVAGVCIEYCVMAGSLDLLFNDLFGLFKAVRQEHVFLEEIEPYILKREVFAVPQNILTALMECCTRSLKFSSLERCVCYLDLNQNDVTELTDCLVSNSLYSGLLYVKAYKSNDYVTAFSTVFEFLMNPRPGTASGKRLSTSAEGFPSVDQAHVGYKLLLFCKYIAENKIFPRGDIQLSETAQIARLVINLLVCGNSNIDEFSVLTPLAKIDAPGAVYCVSLLIARLVSTKETSADVGQLYSRLYAFVVWMDKDTNNACQLQKLFFAFALEQLTSIPQQLSAQLLNGLVTHCSTEFMSRKEAEEMMFGLAGRQSKYPEIAGILRDILVKHSFWKALLGMHNRKQFSANKQDFEAALRFYCGIRGTATNTGSSASANSSGKPAGGEELVFDYIVAQFTAYSMDSNGGPNANVDEVIVEGQSRSRTNSVGSAMQNPLTDARKVLCIFLPELFNISEQRTVKIACQYLANNVGDIISATTMNLKLQCTVLKALITNIKDDAERELSDYFSQSDVLIYIRLLLAFHVDEAYKFISSTSHYPLDEALALCREKEVLDASAHLLERAGDAAGALSLLCTDISKRIQAAKAEIDALLRTDTVGGRRQSTLGQPATSTSTKADASRSILHQILQADKQSSLRQELAASLPCYAKMLHVTDLAASICSRHCTRADTAMWFDTFDHLLKERQNTRVSKSSTAEIVTVLVGMILHAFMANMQGMIPPQEIIRRVTAQQGQGTGSRFSEFKDVMISMVETYAHDVFLNELLKRLHVADLFALHKKKYLRSLVGEKVDASQVQPETTSAIAKVKESVATSRSRAAPRRKRKNNSGGSSGSMQRMKDLLRRDRESEESGQYSVFVPVAPPFHYDPSLYDGDERKKDPYIDEEQSVYFCGDNIRDGDVYKHRAQLIKMVICFNICYREEFVTETIIHRAVDGLPMKTVTVEELSNPHHFFLVRSEKCTHRHHDLRRYSNLGRILRFLCTASGLLSTLRKMFCLEECTNVVHVKTRHEVVISFANMEDDELGKDVKRMHNDIKKPSQVVLEMDVEARETGRITDFLEIEMFNRKTSFTNHSNTICCCIDPYINEEASLYFPGDFCRDGDVYKHRARMVKMVICFNICHRLEFTTDTVIQRASDGFPLKGITSETLDDPRNFFLVKTERCSHRHHDLRRYSVHGRILKFLCTFAGIVSTVKKLCCIEDCVNTVHVKTLRCEKSLYSRRHF